MNRHRAVLAGLCGFLLVGAAACGGYFLRPAPPPDKLQAAAPAIHAPATVQQFTDSRKVQVLLVPGPDMTISVARSGVLTRTDCVPGNPIESGTVIARINDTPLLALHLTVPPFRDLLPGAKGQDVQALQQELARLGIPVEADGYFGWDTVVAVAALRKRTDMSEGRSLGLAELAWLPEQSVPVTECSATLGATLTPGASFAVAKGRLEQAAIESAPAGLVAGERILTMFGLKGPLGEGNRVTDPDFLSALAQNNEVKTVLAGDPNTPVPATLALSTPVEAIQVPTSAVFAVQDGLGCVQSGGTVHQVTVLGSALGASLVALPDGAAPLKEVDLGEAITHDSCSS